MTLGDASFSAHIKTSSGRMNEGGGQIKMRTFLCIYTQQEHNLFTKSYYFYDIFN